MAADDIRPSAIAAAAATLSDSTPPRSGIVHSRSQRSATLVGQPLTLTAEHQPADRLVVGGRAPMGDETDDRRRQR